MTNSGSLDGPLTHSQDAVPVTPDPASEKQFFSVEVSNFMASIQHSNRRRLTADWTPDAPLLLTKRQAALLLNVSERTIGNLLASKQLVRRRIGSRCLITRSSVESFVKRDHPTQVVAEEAKEGGSK